MSKVFVESARMKTAARLVSCATVSTPSSTTLRGGNALEDIDVFAAAEKIAFSSCRTVDDTSMYKQSTPASSASAT